MTRVKEGDRFGQSLEQVLQPQLLYLNSWVKRKYPLAKRDGLSYYAPPLPKPVKEVPGLAHEAAVRPLALFAWSKAALIKTGIYSAKGAELEEAIRDTEWAIRGVAVTHLANEPPGESWGARDSGDDSGSQAIYWASSCAGAAWMLWDRLHASTRAQVIRMLEYEADRLASATADARPDYWKDRDGKLPDARGWGDTKGESNGWIARGLVVAQAMMPEHPNARRWREKASELMISSYSRPSDLENMALVDGKAVKDWLDGFNTFEDGVLLNHERAHPAYMTAHAFTYSTLVDSSFAGQYIPQSAFFNEQVTWDAMTLLNFPIGENRYGTGPNRPPGGTIYHKNANGRLDPTLYFPNGNDWSSNPEADVDYVLFDVYAAVRALDAGQEVRAIDWAAARVEALRRLQARPGHQGNFYDSGDWTAAQDVIEVVTFQDLTEAWVVWWLYSNGKISPVADHWGPVPSQVEIVSGEIGS